MKKHLFIFLLLLAGCSAHPEIKDIKLKFIGGGMYMLMIGQEFEKLYGYSYTIEATTKSGKTGNKSKKLHSNSEMFVFIEAKDDPDGTFAKEFVPDNIKSATVTIWLNGPEDIAFTKTFTDF